MAVNEASLWERMIHDTRCEGENDSQPPTPLHPVNNEENRRPSENAARDSVLLTAVSQSEPKSYRRKTRRRGRTPPEARSDRTGAENVAIFSALQLQHAYFFGEIPAIGQNTSPRKAPRVQLKGNTEGKECQRLGSP